jgi:hypothetical protein
MPSGKRCPYTGTMCGEGTAPAAKEKPPVEVINPAASVAPVTPSKRTAIASAIADLTAYCHRKIWDMEDFVLLKGAYTAKPVPEPVLVSGPKGVGKTRMFWEFCRAEGIEHFRVNLNGGTATEDLLGQWIPTSGGGFVWCDGVLTRMVRNGGCLVLDEINAASPEITFVLHSLLDDERRIVLVQKDGEAITAHQNFWLVSTMNPDYAGTRQLNEALRDRFGIQINLDSDPVVEKAVLTDKHVAAFAKALRNPRAAGKFPDISTRQLLFLQDNKARFGSRVAYQSFVNAVGGDNASREALKMFGEIANVFNSATVEALEKEVNRLVGI